MGEVLRVHGVVEGEPHDPARRSVRAPAEQAGHDDHVTTLALAVEGLTTEGTIAREPNLPAFIQGGAPCLVNGLVLGQDGLPDAWLPWLGGGLHW